jgi:hypothetical protein
VHNIITGSRATVVSLCCHGHSAQAQKQGENISTCNSSTTRKPKCGQAKGSSGNSTSRASRQHVSPSTAQISRAGSERSWLSQPDDSHSFPLCVCIMCRPLSSSWEQRKAAQRAALEAKARHKEELFRAAMEVCATLTLCFALVQQSDSHTTVCILAC